MHDLFSTFNPKFLRSTPEWSVRLGGKQLDGIPLTDFFGSVTQVRKTDGVEYRMAELEEDTIAHEGRTALGNERTVPRQGEYEPRGSPLIDFSTPFLGLAALTVGSFVMLTLV